MEGVDTTALRRWMDANGLGDGPVEQVVALAGGTQNILVGFRRGETGFVLRRPPLHLRRESNDAMLREARMLAALAGTGIPHPRLLGSCADSEVIGAAFYLMEPVDGFNATSGLPPLHAGSREVRQRMGFAMVEAIAALGKLDHVALGLSDFGRPENFLERQVGRWKSQLDGYAAFEGWGGPSGLPGVADIGAWLQRHCPESFEPGIMHGDFHLANVMFHHDSAELAAIVDWELTTIGAPLLDLGWMLAMWPDDGDPDEPLVQPWTGFASKRELIAHYAVTSARDVARIEWYAVLACYKLAIILEGTHARAGAGRAPRDVGDRLHTRAVSLLERARQWAAGALEFT